MLFTKKICAKITMVFGYQKERKEARGESAMHKMRFARLGAIGGLPALIFMAALWAGQAMAAGGPHVVVTSDDPEQKKLDERVNPDLERPVFATNGSTSLNINEDGDPNLSTRF
jgi:hypothetical protein